ncbi:MAG: dockerin type I domain-containing protein [Euryarchaeota archaeon]|nr:dockerin type I domain-containing protein [Euryarchaeota archaeon]
MKNRGMVSIVLVLFAVLALSATGMYAEEQKSCAVLMHGTGSMPEPDDFTVSGNCEEIAYDDGSAEEYWSYPFGGGQQRLAVHFTRPANYETLETARFNIMINGSVPSNLFNWSVLNWTGTEPGDIIASGTTTPIKDGWHDVDMGGISVPKDFVIALRWIHGSAPYLAADINSSVNRSWDYPWTYPGYAWDLEPEKNYLIRAVVCSIGEPDINVTPVAIDLELPLNGSSSETLHICNEGDGDLTYDISISCDTGEWIFLDKAETDGMVAPGNCDDRILTVDTTGLESGNYSATVTISSNDPDKDENPVRVSVSMEVRKSVPPPDLMEGDVNGDGCVSLKDSTAIKLYLVGRMDLNESQLKCADTWDDGEVTMKDSTLIRKWLVDKSTKLWQSPEDDDMEKPVAC